MVYLVFIVYSVLKGLNAISIKMAQKDHVKTLHDSIYFTVLFSFFQLIFLFIIPPYSSYTFRLDMLVYPSLFAVFFFISYVLMITALKEGPTSLTNVITVFNLLYLLLLVCHME